MLSFRSIVFAAALLFAYFYFLNSDSKLKFIHSLSKLTDVESKYRPIEPPPQKIEFSSHAAEAPAPSSNHAIMAAASDDKAQIHLPPQEDELDRLSLPSEQLQRYGTNTFLKQDQGSFQLLRLRAISKYSYDSQMGPRIDEKMNLVFFDPSESSASSLPMTFPVVMKNSNGQLGILSGTLMVTMKDIQQAGLLAQRFGLALKAQDNALDLAYLAAPRADQLGDLITGLRQDPDVKSVEAEIVQNWKKR